MAKFFKKTANLIKETLFPENYTCEICGIEIFKDRLCHDCAETVEFNNGKTCPTCGRKTAKSEICIECKAHLPQFKRAVSAMNYSDGAVRLIAKFKNGHAYLAGYFAELIAPHLENLPHFDGIVYVPMTEKAKSRRGYNQAELLANHISEITGVPVLKDAVVKHKETAEQKDLFRSERVKNLSECFKADSNSVKGKTILAVDDVLTTGATLDALTIALKKSGAKQIFAATCASVEYSPIPPKNESY